MSNILTSSTSFGEYLNAGTTCMKFGQNGRKLRPAGLGQVGQPIHLAIQAHPCNQTQNQVLNQLEEENTSVD